jgi:recombination protein RecR
MDFLPESITRLIEELQQLPGVGPKSAQRLAFHLLKTPASRVESLSGAVANVKKDVVACGTCFSLTTQNPCRICSDPRRDRSLLCVVEGTLDLVAIEKTGEYTGLYHVLQGKISPLEGVGPEDLRIAELFGRLTEEGGEVSEVILALNPDLEGDTTALFLKQKLAAFSPVHVSRIARGIPSGGNLEFTDDATLVRALQGRQSM